MGYRSIPSAPVVYTFRYVQNKIKIARLKNGYSNQKKNQVSAHFGNCYLFIYSSFINLNKSSVFIPLSENSIICNEHEHLLSRTTYNRF